MSSAIIKMKSNGNTGILELANTLKKEIAAELVLAAVVVYSMSVGMQMQILPKWLLLFGKNVVL